MLEVYEIIGFVLLVILTIYLAAFWGTGIFAFVWGSYVHDGEKKVWNLPEYIKSRVGNYDLFLMLIFFGIFVPFVYLILAGLLFKLTKNTGMLIPYIFMAIASAWGFLYAMRSVVRINKRLANHEKSIDAHKGN